jgi:hypothetical protein
MSELFEDAERRDYQIRAIAGFSDNEDQNFLYQGDQGIGKTLIGAGKIAYSLQNNEDYATMVVVPNNNLATQWQDNLDEWSVDELTESNYPGDDSIIRNNGSSDFNDARLRGLKSNEVNALHQIQNDRGKRHEQETQVEPSKEVDAHKRRVYKAADVVVTTYHQLREDLENYGITGDDLGRFDEIFIDEQTHTVARNRKGDEKEGIPGTYRKRSEFEDISDALEGQDTRIIGFSAIPGRKRQAILDEWDAELVSPPKGETNPYTPDVYTNIVDVQDDQVAYTLASIDEHLNKVESLFTNTVEEELGEEAHPGNAIGYAKNDNTEVRKTAQQVLRARQDRKRLLEGGHELLEETLPDDHPYDMPDTPVENEKLNTLANMTENWRNEGDQYLIFTNFTSVADDIAEKIQEDYGPGARAFHGQMPPGERDGVLSDFNSGVIDGIVATYPVGGEGLDLGAAVHAVQTSPEISPQKRKAARGRAARGSDITEHIMKNNSNNQPVPNIVDIHSVPTSRLPASWETKQEVEEMITGEGRQQNVDTTTMFNKF